jgi:hypothetical protein
MQNLGAPRAAVHNTTADHRERRVYQPFALNPIDAQQRFAPGRAETPDSSGFRAARDGLTFEHPF